MSSSSSNFVQSCITTVSFPRDLEGLDKMIRKNEYLPIESHTDLDLILNSKIVMKFREENGYVDLFNWSAPRWMTEGDVIFYYHSKGSLYWSKRVLKESIDYIDDEFLLSNLNHAIELAELYSGKIIGCSEIAGSSEYYPFQDQHFKGRTFAPVKDVNLFKEPIDYSDFSKHVMISRGGTNTPLSRDSDFQAIKKLISLKNELPNYLKKAVIGDDVFKNINKDNWKDISCLKNISFINEDQIRAYFIDYFLNEIKDPKTSVLEECNCFLDYIEGSELKGIVDYFIKLDSNWIPVEAKVNVLNEENIQHQLSKYVEMDYFTPVKGSKIGEKIYNQFHFPLCLLIDHSGLYTFWDGKFINCEPGVPLVDRSEMINTAEIRNYLIENLYKNFGIPYMIMILSGNDIHHTSKYLTR